MEYYENIIACKTEKKLMELWKTKKPKSVSYMEKGQKELYKS